MASVRGDDGIDIVENVEYQDECYNRSLQLIEDTASINLKSKTTISNSRYSNFLCRWNNPDDYSWLQIQLILKAENGDFNRCF